MQEMHYRFLMHDFVPAMQEMRLYIQGIWHIVYGDYPAQQVEFITDDIAVIENLLKSERWEKLEARLQDYIDNYTRRILRYRGSFRI